MDELEEGRIGIRERLGSNNKLWLAVLIVVICMGIIFIARSLSEPKTTAAGKLVENPVGHYLDSKHRDFENGIVKMARGRGERIEAKFLSDKAFKLVTPCDISGDELAYLSRATAMGIWRKFKISPLVWTYTEDINGSNPKLTSRTEWSKDTGDFVVKFEHSIASQ